MTRIRVLRTLAAAGLAASAGLLAAPPAAAQGGAPLVATLTGAAERPGPGDPDGSGTAVLSVNVGQGTLCYTLEVTGIAPARASHVHVAPPDSAGPVVVGLEPPTDGDSSGCATVDRDVLRAIVSDPGAYYVNVHNAEYPAGALRGQLERPGNG